MYLSLIIPAYKEAARIGPTLATVQSYLDKASYESEVIVVDDGSPDNTAEIVRREFDALPKSERVMFHLIAYTPNRGKGGAVQTGMLSAKGDICIFTDADLSTPIYEIEKIFSAIDNEGYDVVIGSRALEGRALVKVHQPWYRETMGRFFNLLVQIFVLRGIKDTQCGFKGFRNAAAKKLFTEQKVFGFSFDVDILFLARKFGFKIKEVAIEWYNDERTTVGALGDSAKMFLQLLKIRGLHK
ncbi:MAG TPA: dolichyl-phosphate beta-glucosyltransferase [Candidatus Kapabacteria bacterium]|nr:dolichyl-phosphate beta-glucosyltransferase [Candidatus Kapabacteria bacterium]